MANRTEHLRRSIKSFIGFIEKGWGSLLVEIFIIWGKSLENCVNVQMSNYFIVYLVSYALFTHYGALVKLIEVYVVCVGSA